MQPAVIDISPGDQSRPRPESPPAQPARLRRLDIDPVLRTDRLYLPSGMDPREAIDRVKDIEVDAAVNHLFFGEQYWAGEPDAPPEPVPASDLPAVDPDPARGAGVTVAILDTGIDRMANRHPSLRARSVVTPDDIDLLDGDRNGYLDHEAGHGTFVAGVFMQQAPGAKFLSYAVLDPAGVGDETCIANAITEAAESGCQIINLSLGGYTKDDQPPARIRDALEQLRDRDVVLVAAAGNAFDETPGERPFWPAAFARTYDWVISVAAGGAANELALFSNRGPWVRARAQGEEVVSTYVKGTWDPNDGGASQFDGYARWSGTSFAAPRVAGAIAAKMNPGGVKARDALKALLGTPQLSPVTDGGGVFIS